MMDNELKALSLFLFANLVSKLLLMYVCSAHCSHYAHMYREGMRRLYFCCTLYREGVRRLYFCCTLCSHSVSRCILCILCVFLQVFLMPRTTGLLCWREVEASVRYVYDCIVWRVVCTYMGCNSVSVDCFRESGHLLNARVWEKLMCCDSVWQQLWCSLCSLLCFSSRVTRKTCKVS